MTDFSELTTERITIVRELAAGNGGPLADHLESGGELHDDQREVLVKYLRGELELKRGNRRTFANQVREWRIRDQVRGLQRHLAILHGSRGSYERALITYLEHPERDPSVRDAALRKIMARNGRGLGKVELKVIDEVRAEFLREHPE